jgi:hypothetical protein
LTFGLGITILNGVSRRKSLAGVNILQKVEFSSIGNILDPFRFA